MCLLVVPFTLLLLVSAACGSAAEEAEVADPLNSLSELQRGTGVIEQMDKQT